MYTDIVTMSAGKIRTKEEIIELIQGDRVLRRKFHIHDTYAYTGGQYIPEIGGGEPITEEIKRRFKDGLTMKPVSEDLAKLHNNSKLIVFVAKDDMDTTVKELHGTMQLYSPACSWTVYGGDNTSQTKEWLSNVQEAAVASEYRMQKHTQTYTWTDERFFCITRKPPVEYTFPSLVSWYDDPENPTTRLILIDMIEHLRNLYLYKPEDLKLSMIVLLPMCLSDREFIELLESIGCNIIVVV